MQTFIFYATFFLIGLTIGVAIFFAVMGIVFKDLREQEHDE